MSRVGWYLRPVLLQRSNQAIGHGRTVRLGAARHQPLCRWRTRKRQHRRQAGKADKVVRDGHALLRGPADAPPLTACASQRARAGPLTSAVSEQPLSSKRSCRKL